MLSCLPSPSPGGQVAARGFSQQPLDCDTSLLKPSSDFPLPENGLQTLRVAFEALSSQRGRQPGLSKRYLSHFLKNGRGPEGGEERKHYKEKMARRTGGMWKSRIPKRDQGKKPALL